MMAVIQVEALKKPCKAWWLRWNSLLAAQPPSSAPAMPIRQVTMSPCCLLPGMSMLAIKPAPSPRTIQAIMPMADSLVSACVECAVLNWTASVGLSLAPVAAHDPPQLGDPGGARGSHQEGSPDSGE